MVKHNMIALIISNLLLFHKTQNVYDIIVIVNFFGLCLFLLQNCYV